MKCHDFHNMLFWDEHLNAEDIKQNNNYHNDISQNATSFKKHFDYLERMLSSRPGVEDLRVYSARKRLM